MTKAFKLILGILTVAFIVTIVISLVCFFSVGLTSGLKWCALIQFILIILCFPCIYLSEAKDKTKRDRESAKKWSVENKVWKNDKEKRGL